MSKVRRSSSTSEKVFRRQISGSTRSGSSPSRKRVDSASIDRNSERLEKVLDDESNDWFFEKLLDKFENLRSTKTRRNRRSLSQSSADRSFPCVERIVERRYYVKKCDATKNRKNSTGSTNSARAAPPDFVEKLENESKFLRQEISVLRNEIRNFNENQNKFFRRFDENFALKSDKPNKIPSNDGSTSSNDFKKPNFRKISSTSTSSESQQSISSTQTETSTSETSKHSNQPNNSFSAEKPAISSVQRPSLTQFVGSRHSSSVSSNQTFNRETSTVSSIHTVRSNSLRQPPSLPSNQSNTQNSSKQSTLNNINSDRGPPSISSIHQATPDSIKNSLRQSYTIPTPLSSIEETHSHTSFQSEIIDSNQNDSRQTLPNNPVQSNSIRGAPTIPSLPSTPSASLHGKPTILASSAGVQQDSFLGISDATDSSSSSSPVLKRASLASRESRQETKPIGLLSSITTNSQTPSASFKSSINPNVSNRIVDNNLKQTSANRDSPSDSIVSSRSTTPTNEHDKNNFHRSILSPRSQIVASSASYAESSDESTEIPASNDQSESETDRRKAPQTVNIAETDMKNLIRYSSQLEMTGFPPLTNSIINDPNSDSSFWEAVDLYIATHGTEETTYTGETTEMIDPNSYMTQVNSFPNQQMRRNNAQMYAQTVNRFRAPSFPRTTTNFYG